MKSFFFFLFLLALSNSSSPDASSNAFDRYLRLFEEQQGYFLNYSIPLKYPDWFRGSFINQGAAVQQMGKYKITSLMDAFYSMNKVEFSEDGALFTTRLQETEQYKASVEANAIRGFCFGWTEPKEIWQMTPGAVQLLCAQGKCDNTLVVNFLLPDGKTFVSTTDSTQWTEFDISDMSFQGQHFDGAIQFPGASHLSHSSNGDLIGADMNPINAEVLIYKVTSEDTMARKEIGKIKFNSTAYFHAFGQGDGFIVMVENPMHYGLARMAMSKPLKEVLQIDEGKTNKIHIMQTEGENAGQYKTYDTGMSFIDFHHGNTFQEGEMIYFDTTTFNPDVSMFETFDLQRIRDNDLNNYDQRYQRISINTTSGKVSNQTWAQKSDGAIDFPKFNMKYVGKKNCFSYLNEFFDTKQEWSIVKIDHCKDITTKYQQPEIYPGEPVFIPNPQGTSEDDGILITFAWDGAEEKSKVILLDGQTMQLYSESELPSKLGFLTHGNFYFQQEYMN